MIPARLLRKQVLTVVLRDQLNHGRQLSDSVRQRSVPLQLRDFSIRRHFASSSHRFTSLPRHEFLIVVPDFPETTLARAKAQPVHMEEAIPLIDAGQITYFGVTLVDHTSEAHSSEHKQKINGSVIVMKAEDEADVREFLARDAYTKAGVWNLEGVKIWPFRGG